jgi:hypothetical protein
MTLTYGLIAPPCLAFVLGLEESGNWLWGYETVFKAVTT